MVRSLRFLGMAVLLAALGGSLASCGIETYKYLDPVDSGIPMLLNTTAYVKLPEFDVNQRSYFRYFIVYYRIYISDLSLGGTVEAGILAQINPALHTDYNYFLFYTNSQSTTVPTTMGATFSGRKYFPLELDNTSIERILAEDSVGKTITLDFSENPPALIMGDIRTPPSTSYPRHQLSRNTRNNNRPYADNYYFVNSEDINNSDHISSDSSNTNQDVEKSAQSGAASGSKYTYVSMYILAYGLDDSFINIYSSPTFLGIFRLPNENE